MDAPDRQFRAGLGGQPVQDSDHEFNSVWEIDWEGKSRIVGNEHPSPL